MKKVEKRLLIVLCFVIASCALCISVSASTDVKAEYYGRDALAKLEKSTALIYAYDNISEGIESSLAEINVYDGKTPISRDEIDMVFDAYRRDHTEHFWLGNGYGYRGTSETITTLVPQYLYSGNELETKKVYFEKAVSDILAGVKPSMSEFEKELFIHDALAKKVVYIGDFNAHNAYGALVEGRAVCEGYAEAFQYLLQRVGIQSFIVIGSSVNPSTQTTEGHAWNIVRIDGEYYHVDLTWNDQNTHIYHAYFNLKTSDILADHAIDSSIYKLPECDSDKSMYFNVNGGKISSITVAEFGDLLKKNGLTASVYVEGSKDEFIVWVKANITDIAKVCDISGQFSYAYSILGNEIFISFSTCPHDKLTKIGAVEASCTSGGNKEHYVCECGSIFADANASTPIDSYERVYTIALGHHISDIIDENENRFRVCTVCGYEFGEIADDDDILVGSDTILRTSPVETEDITGGNNGAIFSFGCGGSVTVSSVALIVVLSVCGLFAIRKKGQDKIR